jgi:DnaK suppressor protein
LPRVKKVSERRRKTAKKRNTRPKGKPKRKGSVKTAPPKRKKTTGRATTGVCSRKPEKGKVRSVASRSKAPKVMTEAARARMEKLRTMLETKRAEILGEIKRARQDSLESDRTSFPEVGDLVSASVQKERAFEYGEIGVNALREINNALEKLKAGTYGICEICEKPIGYRRLEAMPSARLCIKCKAEQESLGGITPAGKEKD